MPTGSHIESQNIDILKALQNNVEVTLKEQINFIFDVKVKEATELINQKRNEMISRIAMDIDSWYDVTYQGSTLRITFIDRSNNA